VAVADRVIAALLAATALQAVALGSACRRGPTRAQVLGAMVEHTILPGYRARVAAFAELRAAVERLAEQPAPDRLAAARDSWRRSLAALKRTYGFRSGPTGELDLHYRLAYFPVRPASIEALLAGDKPLPAALAESGVAVKGLFALEYLLFDPAGGDGAVLAALTGSPRRRQWLVLAARELEARAAELVRASAQALPAQVAREGGQPLLGRLANEMLETVESVVVGKLDHVTTLARSGALGRGRLEGERSGSAGLIADAMLEGVDRLYRGPGDPAPGLRVLVQAAAPAVDARVLSALAGARTALSALDLPLERAAREAPDRLARARVACHALEVAMKADMMNALAVTLTFRSIDGD
jgi:uncharacterized protein